MVLKITAIDPYVLWETLVARKPPTSVPLLGCHQYPWVVITSPCPHLTLFISLPYSCSILSNSLDHMCIHLNEQITPAPFSFQANCACAQTLKLETPHWPREPFIKRSLHNLINKLQVYMFKPLIGSYAIEDLAHTNVWTHVNASYEGDGVLINNGSDYFHNSLNAFLQLWNLQYSQYPLHQHLLT